MRRTPTRWSTSRRRSNRRSRSTIPASEPDPLGAAQLVLDLALLVTLHGLVVVLVEAPHEVQAERLQGGPRGPVHRHRLGEDPGQAEILEAVPHQCPGAFGPEPLPPPATQQAVAEIGLAGDERLARPVRRLEHPDAHELRRAVVANEAGPDAEPVDITCPLHPAGMRPMHLLRRGGPGTEVAQHL